MSLQGLMMDYPLTLTPALARAEQLFGTREIVSRLPDKSVHRTTYASFVKRTRALAAVLTDLGLKKGDRVATLMWNHHAHLEAYFGIPCAGGVLHTLNLRLHPDDLAYIVNHAEDRFLIVDDVLLPLLAKFRDRVKFEKILVVPQTGANVAAPDLNYESALMGARKDYVFPELDEKDASGMCYTSGTTGKPKGVLYNHRSVVLHSFAVMNVDGLGLSGNDSVLPVVPQFHANAWGIPFAAVMAGSKIVMPGPHLDAHSVLDLFEKEEVTISLGVPTVWLAIQEALEKEPGRYKLQPHLRMVVGGSAAPESMIRAFDKVGMEAIHAWGMTETSPLGTVARIKPELRNASDDVKYATRAKQGVPAPYVDIRAVNDVGPVAWDGKSPGELQVRGPWVASAYYKPDNAGSEGRWTADGWFRTGDVVTLDEHGYVKITDRTKDLIKSGGEWISSVDLENALMGHPAVREAAVVAVPHPKWTERPLAVLVAKPGMTATNDELKTYLGARFSKFSVPEAYVFVESIPRTSAGKFLKSALRDQYQNWKW